MDKNRRLTSAPFIPGHLGAPAASERAFAFIEMTRRRSGRRRSNTHQIETGEGAPRKVLRVAERIRSTSPGAPFFNS